MRISMIVAAGLVCACGGSDKQRALTKVNRKANDVMAIMTVRNLVSAQAQLQSTARADEDQDGEGEYGGLAELAGSVGVRGGRRFDPPVLKPEFARVRAGRVERHGYYIRVFLPAKGGGFVGEQDEGGFAAGVLDPDRCEREWRCYVWPVEHGKSGSKTYFVDQWGDIMVTDASYSGDRAPAAGAYRSRTGPHAKDGRATDGNTWQPLIPDVG